RGKRRSFNPSIMQRLTPKLIEVRTTLLLPIALHNVVAACTRLPAQQRDHFMGALAVIKRSNQRLNDAHGTVISTAVTPRFQIVPIVTMPQAKLGRFILIESVMNANWNIGAF